MKRPEYVSAAVRACKEQRDNGFISEDTAEILKNVFHEQDLPTVIIQAKQAMKCSDTAEKRCCIGRRKTFSKIRQSYKDELSDIAINGTFTAKIGENPTLEITDGTHNIKLLPTLSVKKQKRLRLTRQMKPSLKDRLNGIFLKA